MGENAEAAKVNMMKQMEFLKESAIEDGFEYTEFLTHLAAFNYCKVKLQLKI